MKICVICNITKDYEFFHINKREVDGRNKTCKDCRKIKSKIFYQKNKEKISKKRSEEYYKNQEENLKKDRIRIQKERERRKKYSNVYSKKNNEKIIEYRKKYYQKNKESIIGKTTEWRKNNKSKLNETINNRNKYRKQNDPLYKLKCIMKTNFYISFKKFKKSKKIQNVLGISLENFKEYLEKQFLPNMSWENHSKNGWHIDHIIPLSSAKNEEELYKLWHYTNMRPLWAVDNLKKSNKILSY
jgi:hypothetical protein